MLSQLNLRFHKKLIEALKTRAGRENTSVNALAERFLDDGLKTVAPGDGYFQLIADPEATVRQLYRHIILGQTFGTSALSRDELRFVRHCCKVSDEAAFCLIQRPYISKTLLTRRISPRGSP